MYKYANAVIMHRLGDKEQQTEEITICGIILPVTKTVWQG